MTAGRLDLAQGIKDPREKLGMIQERFAHAPGVLFSTVSRWESGGGSPSPPAQPRLDESPHRDAEKHGS